MEAPDLRMKNCKALPSCLVGDLPGDPEEYALEPKFDGFRVAFHVTDDGVKGFTRAMKSQDGRVPYIEEELARIFPSGTVLDGEIVGMQIVADQVVNDFEHVQSIMLSKPERSVRVALETRPLDYVMFDMPYMAGRDIRELGYSDRRYLLGKWLEGEHRERVALAPAYGCDQGYHESICELGFEGTVAKHKTSLYESGKRGRGWWKLKTQVEVDAVVMGWKPGTPGSEFDGLVGAIVFGQPHPTTHELVERGSCSGITWEERQRLSQDPEGMVGKVMSFGHMGVYPEGVRFRHPQFKRWRPDKPRREVIWDAG